MHAVSGADGKVTSVPVAGAKFGPPTVVATALRTERPDLTAVGTTWVAYDAAEDRVYTASAPDGTDAQVTTPGGPRYAALQQPGPDADTVAVAGPERAVLVPLDGGASPGGVAVQERVDRVPGGTLVTRPVVLGGCLHAAWAEAGRVFYGANCGRAGDEPTATLPAEGTQETRDGVAFRVNRGLVVLNDLDNGGVWDLDDKPTKIDNWDALVPPTRTDDDQKKKDENLVDEASLDQPPKAEPDELAVRPGRTASCTCSTTTPTWPGRCSRSTRPTSPAPRWRGSRRPSRATVRPSTSACPTPPPAGRSPSATGSTTAR